MSTREHKAAAKVRDEAREAFDRARSDADVLARTIAEIVVEFGRAPVGGVTERYAKARDIANAKKAEWFAAADAARNLLLDPSEVAQ